VPSYYCWDVTRFVAARAPIVVYACGPTSVRFPREIDSDDLLLVASYFGTEPAVPAIDPEQLVLDTSHDPLAEWQADYEAAWVFGSLRKCLPLAEGGYAHSRQAAGELLRGLENTNDSRTEAARGAEAMAKKALWAAGSASSDKEVWYLALQEHEAAFEGLDPALMQPETLQRLQRLPVNRWRKDRLHNLNYLRQLFGASAVATPLPGTYGLPLLFPTVESARETERRLLEQHIYPARIWPQPIDAPQEDLYVADRLILLHTDYRYCERDMERIASVLLESS
jgi:hypothetical protein